MDTNGDKKHISLEVLKASKKALLAALEDAGAKIINESLDHCRCFKHKEENGSLSVFRRDGQTDWGWYCHVCAIGGSIIDVLIYSEGLTQSEAVREAIEHYGDLGIQEEESKPSEPVKPARKPVVFLTLEEAAATLEGWSKAKCTRCDIYTDKAGVPHMAILRLDLIGEIKKEFRPLHKTLGGWQLGDPPKPLPLFNLVGLHGDTTAEVLVVEGEKTAIEMIALGFMATTSSHGANSAAKTDWSPLAGRRVVVWPDNDEAGGAYADEVISILNALTPAAISRVVNVKDLSIQLPVGGDAVDYVEALKK